MLDIMSSVKAIASRNSVKKQGVRLKNGCNDHHRIHFKDSILII